MFSTQETGKKISVLRRKVGLTQMALANKLGISYQAVSNWERGVAMPDISNLGELATILGTTVDELIGDTKTAEALSDISKGKKPENLKADEFVAISPMLTPEQNDIAAESLSERLSREQAEEVKNNMGFGGDYESDDDELAEKFYENGNIAMFSIISDDISDECRARLLKRSADDNSIAFFSVLYKDGAENTDELAEKFYDSKNIAMFAIVSDGMSEEMYRKLSRRALSDGNIAFFAILHRGSGSSSDVRNGRDKLRELKEKLKRKKEERRKARSSGSREEASDLKDEIEELEDEIEELEDDMDED